MEEIWKECHISKYYRYEVSNKGFIRSIHKKSNIVNIRKLCFHIDKSGYKSYRISMKDISGVAKTFKIAKLVSSFFIGEKPLGLEIDHINRDSLDNRVENLRYVTRTENARNTRARREDILEEDPSLRRKLIIEGHRWKQAIIYQCDCGKMTSIQHQSRHCKSAYHQKHIQNQDL